MRFKNPKHLFSAGCLASFALICGGVREVSGQGQSLPDGNKPNIVFILADDLGWSDLACYGNRFHNTPNLDRLAAQGMRFTQGYAPAPICSASRAAFLTGRSPARLGFEFVTKDKPGGQTAKHRLKTPPFTLNLPLEEVTFAERLKEAGYVTGFSGKWHVNQHHRRYLGWSPTHGPEKQGFDHAIETFGSHPYGFPRKAPAIDPAIEDGAFPRDAVTENAIAFMRANRDKPFLLDLCHYYVHTPVKSRSRWLLDKYETRIPRGVKQRANRVRYGAFVETLDHYIGQLTAALDELALADNTLLVFTSDNGGHPEYADNAPLRGSKWNLYEGGIRVPFIVRWPGRVKAGEVSDEPVVGTDLFPTFVEAAGAKSDPRREIDGVSLLPVLRGGKGLKRKLPMVWHFPYYHPETKFDQKLEEIGVSDFAVSRTYPQSAIRIGRHKLVRFYEDDRPELYDLSGDVSEQVDLARKNRELGRELGGKLDDYLKRVHARLPRGGE